MVLALFGPVLYKRYKDSLDKKDDVEKFDSSEDALYAVGLVVNLLNLLITGIALYLCFKRNGPEINFGAVVIAFCCPICYIVYALAVPVG
jgi:hypothetical protein